MATWTLRGMRTYGSVALVLAAACAAACGGGSNASSNGPHGTPGAVDDGGSIPSLEGEGGVPQLGSRTLASIAIAPATASIESIDGAAVTQAFSIVAQYTDGSSGALTDGVSWSASVPQAGSIAPTGIFTASGSIGSVVPVTATVQGMNATASLTVKLHLHQGVTTVGADVVTSLGGATTPDASVTWAYPYNGTVFPRGLLAPVLQWNGGTATDDVYVHVTSPTFELESYAAAPGPTASFTFDPTTWQQLTDSTTGATALSVARWSGTAATVIASHSWTIAPQSMRGTIYYWAQNIGRVVRIKPGAPTPDDFANAPPLNDTSVYPSSSCLMTCHTVSANGAVLVSGGGSFGGSFSLATGQPMYSLGGVWGGGTNGATDNAQVVQWSNSALSPDGAYVVENQLASQLSQAVAGPAINGMFKTADGTAVATSGVPADPLFMPAFSPDATKMVYVAGTATVPADWISSATPGALRVMDFNEAASPMLSNARDLVQPAAAAYTDISWPTVSPDGHWALYARLNSTIIDSRGTCGSSGCDYATLGDMYLADTTTPNSEIRLAALDGDSYPFAAGARDLHYNFEPTFAPVAAGGYFWVVFTSRRTYGNVLTGTTAVTKQLWVAAIDQNPKPGVDPSHPAFLLPGQDATTLNLRGFWALDPCKGAGQGCASGTECCGGYCDGTGGDSGGPVCTAMAPACAADGDKCNVASDCCTASAGTTCINHVCSEAAPK
jgi:hypothetical protein